MRCFGRRHLPGKTAQGSEASREPASISVGAHTWYRTRPQGSRLFAGITLLANTIRGNRGIETSVKRLAILFSDAGHLGTFDDWGSSGAYTHAGSNHGRGARDPCTITAAYFAYKIVGAFQLGMQSCLARISRGAQRLLLPAARLAFGT